MCFVDVKKNFEICIFYNSNFKFLIWIEKFNLYKLLYLII